MSAPKFRLALLPAALLAALPLNPVRADDAGLDAATNAVADLGLDAAGATRLDAVQVTGERPEGYVAGPTATATRLELSPRETPQSISVVSRAQMDDFGLDSVNEVLGAVTGVNVEQVETDRSYYSARGFDIVNFQRDGLGIPLPYGIQDGDMDTALYERIEVLRGANGLLSSTGNPSATVNFVRKRPGREFDGSLRLGLGSWNRRRLDADVGGPLGGEGALRGRAVLAWEEGDSYLDRYEQEKQLLYGVLETDLGQATTLAAGASWQRNRPTGVLWGALPLFYSDGSRTDYDRSTSTAADWSYWYSDDLRAFVDLEHEFGSGWNLRAALNWHRTEQDTQLFYVYGTPDPDTGLGLFAYPSDYEGEFEATEFDLYATGPISLGGREHELVLGLSSARGDNREISWYGNDVGTPLAPGQAFDGSYPRPVFDAYSDGADFDYERDSAYASVRWNLADRVKLITGANRSRVETAGVSYGTPNTVDETRTTAFAGAVVDLNRVLSAYASYGEIFNQQAETDIDDELLGPITGDNAELGLKGEWFEGHLNAGFALFRARQRNLAEYAGFDTASGRSYYVGTDAESRGFEFDLAGRIGEHWQLSAGYTQLSLETPDGAEARTWVPRKLLHASAAVQVPQVEGLSLGMRVRWQDGIHREAVAYDALGNATPLRIEQDAYALWSLMARYEFAEAWSASLVLDNLTDEKYIPSLYWEQGFYGAPRNATLSLAYRF
ncbi:TonB-dependent siderophore receptor [Arenimonas fontis]|nr:TonB-dependent siderophore receptor [Arenimonas fontis]